jgi:hypothetical protein
VLEVKEEPAKPYALTLSSGGNDVTTDSSVTVGGKVTPAPPAGTTLSVAVGVNGVPVVTVPVDGSGAYFATFTLPKLTTVAKLTLSNPPRNLTTCGAHPASVVTLFNTAGPADVQNVINAAVVKDGGGVNSNVAEITVTHAVKLLSAQVLWTGRCSGANDTFPVAGKVLRSFESLELGTIPCGLFPCPGFKDTCAPVARVSVDTSVGFIFADAVWNVDVK